MEPKLTTEPLLRSYFSGLSGAPEELCLIFPISSVLFMQLSKLTFKNVLWNVCLVSCWDFRVLDIAAGFFFF